MDKELYVYGKLIEGITVLSVKDSQGYHINQKSASQKDAVALIYSVPEDQHLLLRKALFLNPQGIVPGPRNSAYSQSDVEANISSDYLKGLINARCKDVPLDTVSNSNNNNVKITE